MRANDIGREREREREYSGAGDVTKDIVKFAMLPMTI